MQNCTECGTPNPAGAEFCSGCTGFLAWEDPKPRPGAPSPASPPKPDAGPSSPPPTGEPPESPRGPARPPTRHNPDKVRRVPPGPVERDDPTVVLPRLPDPGTGSGHRWGDPSPPDGTERPASSRVQGPGSYQPSEGPASVPPGDIQPPPPPPPEPKPKESLAPGERACPRCGTGNPPDRHFCRRCALELRRTAAPEVVPAPPPPRRGRSPVVWVLALLAVLAFLLLQLGVLDALAAPDASGPASVAAIGPAGTGQTDADGIPRDCSMSW